MYSKLNYYLHTVTVTCTIVPPITELSSSSKFYKEDRKASPVRDQIGIIITKPFK